MEMTIGANIKRLRTAKNITQEQLSMAMNVTCAAVSKWERGETYPDITLLQPLAYFFEVTLDELMGYDQKKVQADIDETIALYRKHWKDSKGREIIVKAYHDYPNDYRIKENLPEIRDKLRYKKYVEESVETLEKQVKEVRERLNFGKRRKEKEITREEAEMLGMRYGAGEKIAKGWREKKQRKTLIARYGTKKELEKEFGSAGKL